MLQQVRRVGQHAFIYAAFRQELMADMLRKTLGEYRWDISLGERRMVFGSQNGKITATAHLLASVAVNPPTLLWGHAPPFAPYVGPEPLAARIRELGMRHGLDELARGEVAYGVAHADGDDVVASLARDVGMLGVEFFGPETAYYSAPIGNGGSRQVFLLEDFSRELPPVAIEALFPALGRYVASIDDVPWSFEGLVRLLPGWRLERVGIAPGTEQLRVYDEAGASFAATITRDARGLPVNLNLSGIRPAR